MCQRGVLTLTIFFFYSGGVQVYHGSGEFSHCASEEYLPLFFSFFVGEEGRSTVEVGSSPIVPARSTYLIFLLFVGEEGRSTVEVGSSPVALAGSSPECHPANQAGRLLLSTPH